MDDQNVQCWQRAFRAGVLPEVSTRALKKLRKALEADSALILQGATICPPPLQCTLDWRCEAACGLAWLAADGDEPDSYTVGQLDILFTQLAMETDRRLGEPAGIRHFIHWFDETPREEMRRLLLLELDRALAERQEQDVPDLVRRQLRRLGVL